MSSSVSEKAYCRLAPRRIDDRLAAQLNMRLEARNGQLLKNRAQCRLLGKYHVAGNISAAASD